MEKESVQRKDIRIALRDGARARISIYNLFGAEVASGEAPVLLEDLSPSGFRFKTHLRFPVSNDYSIRAIITLGDWQFNLLGHIVWRRKEDQLYVYGCNFLADRRIRQSIVRALYERMVALRPGSSKVYRLYQLMTEQETRPGSRIDLHS